MRKKVERKRETGRKRHESPRTRGSKEKVRTSGRGVMVDGLRGVGRGRGK